MSEERLERLENLLLDLVKMVGANNTALHDLKADMSGVKSDVSGLKADVSGLKADVSELKADVSVLKADVSELKVDVSELKVDMVEVKRNQELFRDELFTQSARLDEYFRDLSEKLSGVALNANYAVSMVAKHDKEIFAIKEKLSF